MATITYPFDDLSIGSVLYTGYATISADVDAYGYIDDPFVFEDIVIEYGLDRETCDDACGPSVLLNDDQLFLAIKADLLASRDEEIECALIDSDSEDCGPHRSWQAEESASYRARAL